MHQEIMHLVCGGHAFNYIGGARAGERIDRNRFMKRNGQPLGPDEMPRCGACGRVISATTELAPGLNVYQAGSTEDMEAMYGVN